MQRSSRNNARARFALNLGPSPLWSPALIAVIAGVTLPLVLIPVIHATGFSEVVEEVSKGIAVWTLAFQTKDRRTLLWFALAFGALFGCSESMLYANQIAQLGLWSVLGLRLALTIPLHAFTAWCIAYGVGRWRMRGLVFGVCAGIVVHLLFNAQGF